MKVSDLVGAQLDYWVGKAEFGVSRIRNGADAPFVEVRPKWRFQSQWQAFSPSTDWRDGGPIIERERIGVMPRSGLWAAWPSDGMDATAVGDTVLVAAMRAFVISKLGENVEDLING